MIKLKLRILLYKGNKSFGGSTLASKTKLVRTVFFKTIYSIEYSCVKSRNINLQNFIFFREKRNG